jgi:ABC-type transport system involved in cytochrome bd biosynthesis fused ATPase/permease subunit
LDIKNEKEIIQNILQYLKEKTVIIISHRLSILQNTTGIILLEKNGSQVRKVTKRELQDDKLFKTSLSKN